MTFDNEETPPPPAAQPLPPVASQLRSPLQSTTSMHPPLPPSVERAAAAQVLMVHENALLQQIPKVTDSGRQTIAHLKYMVTLVDKLLSTAEERHAKVKDEETQLAAHVAECRTAKQQYDRHLELMTRSMAEHESFVKAHEVSRAKIRSQALAREATLDAAGLPHKSPTPANASVVKNKNAPSAVKKAPRSVPPSPAQSIVIPATAPPIELLSQSSQPAVTFSAGLKPSQGAEEGATPTPSLTAVAKKKNRKSRKASQLLSQESQPAGAVAKLNPFLTM